MAQIWGRKRPHRADRPAPPGGSSVPAPPPWLDPPPWPGLGREGRGVREDVRGGEELVDGALRAGQPGPGHPAWLGPTNVPDATTPYVLVAKQPRTRLHSQFDFGGHSGASKHRGREVARMHPQDAAARGIAEGDIIRLYNERGACLSGVTLTDGIRPGVIQLPTGAWYDPVDPDEEKRVA